MLTLEMIKEAQKNLAGVARVTPLNPAANIGPNVYIKAENLQMTGAFKLRGAYNKMSSLTPEQAATLGKYAPYVVDKGESISLNAEGWLISNRIISELI